MSPGARRADRRRTRDCNSGERQRLQHSAEGEAAQVLDNGRRAEDCEADSDEPPRADRGQPRQQAEPARKRSGDCPNRVRRVGQTDLPADALARPTEQRNQQRELIARNQCRGQDDERGNERPSRDARVKPGALERQQRNGEECHAIAERVRARDRDGLDEAGRAKRRERSRPVVARERVHQTANADPGERHSEDQAERENRSPKEWSEEAIPDQLHEQERKAHATRGKEKEPTGAGGW